MPDKFFYNIFQSVYSKRITEDLNRLDKGMMIGLTKWLSNDHMNLKWLSKIIQYQFYIEPKHYFYLLYFGIRKCKPFYLSTFKKTKKEEDGFEEKLKRVFNWSQRELEYNMPLINFLSLREKLSEEIGYEDVKKSKKPRKNKRVRV